MDAGKQAARGYEVAGKVAQVFQARTRAANQHFQERLAKAVADAASANVSKPLMPFEAWSAFCRYVTDAAQRSILFWDTLRQRGNNYLEHNRQGMPPVLHFAYEVVVDARTLGRPVNYALVRIVPPEGVNVDPKRRPYVIIDPRAGHGPGIGGFKDDSQVGVALRAGHPVYFAIFFPRPEPGQTLLDVCAAEQIFVRKVRELHPDSPKPAIVGNCQGGWAAMMLAASDPDDTGPIVINGAPMSYWGGAWAEGGNDNPMRYAGGLLGGTWMSSWAADLGNGEFDGAHLVSNFEKLNPANTLWTKYYHLYANVDTEPSRFLEFERWWSGYYLMNREEIEWITRNLFVGNKLWKGGTQGPDHKAFDLRAIKSPIVLFASMGDNITPPQQAFNWIADVYESTDEIKALGQTIVGLLNADVGHLGIFVSGKVAKKEHTEIVSVLQSIEALPPGLYAMDIIERKGADGSVEYEVEFEERQLEDVVMRLNRFNRIDEKPFEAVAEISEFNQRAYELFAQPLVQSMSNELTAKLGRDLNPLRVQRWAFSDMNPWLAWLGPTAEAVRRARAEAASDGVAPELRGTESAASDAIVASLDYYRDVRDALTEASFFQIYGNAFSLYLADRQSSAARGAPAVADARELPFVQEALAAIDKGGYAEACARMAALLARHGEALPLSWIAAESEMAVDYRDLLPDLPPDAMRRVRGEQDIIVRYARERAIETMPALLRDRRDRERLLELATRLMADPRVQAAKPSANQLAAVHELEQALLQNLARRNRATATRLPVSAAAAASSTLHSKKGHHGRNARKVQTAP
jgi:pimeloyl-ACP methyl ester carboxylesterase